MLKEIKTYFRQQFNTHVPDPDRAKREIITGAVILGAISLSMLGLAVAAAPHIRQLLDH